jgi:predicted component of type VI protein secretion system
MVHRAAAAGLVAAAVKARQLGHLEKEEEKELVTQACGLQHDLIEQRTRQFHQMEQALDAEQSSLQVTCRHPACGNLF